MSDYDEWRAAVAGMSDTERAITELECRRALGMCGDREDARYER
ncbi:microaggregate invasion protein 1 [Mycobacterium avium]